MAGASEFFRAGWVSYSNRAKERCLEVDPLVIERYGAVSEQVAGELAEGARRVGESDYGIGITGIAGPGGGTEEKPVGLVYIGLAEMSGVTVKRYVFGGDRERIRRRAVYTALDMLRHRLI